MYVVVVDVLSKHTCSTRHAAFTVSPVFGQFMSRYTPSTISPTPSSYLNSSASFSFTQMEAPGPGNHRPMVNVVRASDVHFARNLFVLFTYCRCSETCDKENSRWSMSYIRTNPEYGFVNEKWERFVCERGCMGGYIMDVLHDSNASERRYISVRTLCDCRLKGLEMEMRLLTSEEVETVKERIEENSLAFKI
jgi:hypothetical protein